MIFSMLPARIATILIGKKPVIITFISTVLSVGGVSDKSLLIHQKEEFNQGKTIILEPRTTGIKENLIVFTKERSYEFHVISSLKNTPHDFIKVLSGKTNSFYTKMKETNDYVYYEGKDSIKIVNKRNTAIEVNGILVKTQDYFSKGIPLFIKHGTTFNNEKQIFIGNKI